MIRIGIVDDEPHGVDNLCSLLTKHCPETKVVYSNTDAIQAAREIENQRLDLLMLDIRMPALDGFQLLAEVDHENFEVIFVTAHSDYALRALRMSALDYLLKPIDPNELILAISRFLDRKSKLRPQQMQIAHEVFTEEIKPNQIAVRKNNELQLIDLSEILYCKAENNYSWFYLEKKEKFIVSKTLKHYERLLMDYDFFRVHQSYLINLTKVKALSLSSGTVRLSDGARIPVAKVKRGLLRKALQGLSL